MKPFAQLDEKQKINFEEQLTYLLKAKVKNFSTCYIVKRSSDDSKIRIIENPTKKPTKESREHLQNFLKANRSAVQAQPFEGQALVRARIADIKGISITMVDINNLYQLPRKLQGRKAIWDSFDYRIKVRWNEFTKQTKEYIIHAYTSPDSLKNALKDGLDTQLLQHEHRDPITTSTPKIPIKLPNERLVESNVTYDLETILKLEIIYTEDGAAKFKDPNTNQLYKLKDIIPKSKIEQELLAEIKAQEPAKTQADIPFDPYGPAIHHARLFRQPNPATQKLAGMIRLDRTNKDRYFITRALKRYLPKQGKALAVFWRIGLTKEGIVVRGSTAPEHSDKRDSEVKAIFELLKQKNIATLKEDKPESMNVEGTSTLCFTITAIPREFLKEMNTFNRDPSRTVHHLFKEAQSISMRGGNCKDKIPKIQRELIVKHLHAYLPSLSSQVEELNGFWRIVLTKEGIVVRGSTAPEHKDKRDSEVKAIFKLLKQKNIVTKEKDRPTTIHFADRRDKPETLCFTITEIPKDFREEIMKHYDKVSKEETHYHSPQAH